MKTTHILVTIFTLLTTAGIATARKYNPDAVLPQLRQQLAQATTPLDSVKILYDIYDISPRTEQTAIGRQLYEVAGRARDVNAQLDIMRLNSNLYNSDKEFDRLRKQTLAMPRSREQRETDLFLQMRKLSFSTRQPNAETTQKIATIINKMNTSKVDKTDDIDRLLNLYTVAAYMRNVPDSKLLEQYVDSMVHMVNSNHYSLYALRNIIYSEAANIYSDAGQTKKAVEANRNMLAMIDGLERKYRNAGRKYRDYDISRYIVYRRMLRNYKALTPAEVDKYYNEIQKLAQSNSDVAADLQRNRTPLAYYHMAKGHYADAIPLLQEAIEGSKAFPVTRQLHCMLQTAARETGDSATLMSSLATMDKLNQNLEESHLAERYRELQVAYEVNSMEAHQYKERVRNAEAETARLRSSFSYNLLIWGLFAILLAVLLFYWTRYRSNIERLRHLADSMAMQRDVLKNNKYNDYDSHAYYVRETHVKTSDTRALIESIMTSVLYTAAIGNNERDNHVEKQSANAILRKTAEDSERQHMAGIDLKVEYCDPDFDITTDVECMVYVLDRILLFAKSRSNGDAVTLTARHTDRSGTAQFIFTHSGQRIQRGNEEALFEHIFNMSEMEKRDDSLMMTCRLIALLLQCNVTYNPHIDGPAKLIISLPMRRAF